MLHKRRKGFFYVSIAIFMLGFGACSRSSVEKPEVPKITEMPTAIVNPEEVTPPVRPNVSTTPALTATPSPVPAMTPTPTPRPEPTLTPAPIPTTRPTETPESTKIPSPKEPVVVGADGILVDNELCKVQLVSFGKEESDVVLRLSVENRSERDLIFSATEVCVNRVKNSVLEIEVPAGESAEERVLLFSLEQELGITDLGGITEILIPLAVYDARQVTYEAIWSGRGNMPWLEEWSLCDWPCVIYPQGEESAIPFSYERKADDIVMVENEFLSMLLVDEVYEEGGGYTAKVYVENHTEAPLFLRMEEYSLNGFRCEPYRSWETYLQGNTKVFGTIYWYGERLEESEGDEVEKLGFSLYANGDDIFSRERYWVYPKGEAAVKEYSYIPGEQDVILYEGPECILALTGFTTKTKKWDEKMLAATAYFENKSEGELSFRIEETEQAYMRYGVTDEWNTISADLWSKDVGAGEKQKLVLYLAEYPENDEDDAWDPDLRVIIERGGEDFVDERISVSVPIGAFED